MQQSDKKKCFIELGHFLRQFTNESSIKNNSVLHNALFYDAFNDLIELSQSHNGWYTKENVLFSISSWSQALTEENLNQWLNQYDFTT